MNTAAEVIQRNYQSVQEQIEKAAQSAGRNANEIQLVVVTKAQPVDVVRAVIQAGASVLGENYPEETQLKIEAIGKPIHLEWHMIGHLQSRKAGLVIQYFDMLESLDSLKLAERLGRLLTEFPGKKQALPVLLEFNVGGEESKNGWFAQDMGQWETILPDIEQLLAIEGLSVQGLMTMPPWSENSETSRQYFVQLRKLSDFLKKHFPKTNLQQLSMGTSGDYTIAVQEGATMVRIGEAILGPRPKKV